jgi:hypothetical protein
MIENVSIIKKNCYTNKSFVVVKKFYNHLPSTDTDTDTFTSLSLGVSTLYVAGICSPKYSLAREVDPNHKSRYSSLYLFRDLYMMIPVRKYWIIFSFSGSIL